MNQWLIIGNGKKKNSLTLVEEPVTDYIHSEYPDEKAALRMAHWLNKLPTALVFYVIEKSLLKEAAEA